MEAVRTSETSVNFYEIHGATSQKIVIFKVQVVLKERALLDTAWT
jgi:hypothetical protein